MLKKLYVIFLPLIFFFFLCLLQESDLLARAGGYSGSFSGGGGSSIRLHYVGGNDGGDIVYKLAMLAWGGLCVGLYFWYYLWPKYLILKRHLANKNTVEELSKNDLNWSFKVITSRIESTFYKVQEAWTKRDYDIANDYMSKSLHFAYKTETNQMRKRKQKNILKKIKFKGAKILRVEQNEDKSKADILWVRIKGKMIDYMVNEKTGQIISGYKDFSFSFKEVWKFKKSKDKWVLDQIKSDIKNDMLIKENFLSK